MKKATMMLTLILAIAANIYASTTNVIGGPVATAKDKQNIRTFNSMKGTDRVDAFKKIQPLILLTDGIRLGQSDLMGITPTTQTDIQNMIGVPDVITEGNFWVYNLKDNASSCKVVFGFDKAGQATFCTIKDCN